MCVHEEIMTNLKGGINLEKFTLEVTTIYSSQQSLVLVVSWLLFSHLCVLLLKSSKMEAGHIGMH